MIVQEAFFGKVIALKKLEKLIDKLKAKYSPDWTSYIVRIHNDINKDPIIQEMIQLITDQFGFKETMITITKSTKYVAQVIVLDDQGSMYNKKDDKELASLIRTNEGLRFNTKKGEPPCVLIIISMGMLLSNRITSGEIVAGLLHEIGHAFSKSTLLDPNFNDRVDEKFADNFAIMYGYGPELSSILSKSATYRQYEDIESLRKIPIVNIFLGLKSITSSLINRGISGNVHPTLYHRMTNTISQLEYELNNVKNLTRKQKQEIQSNIDKAKAQLDSYYADTPYASDSLYKYYLKNIEPSLGKETRAESIADKVISADIMNQKISSIGRR